MNRILILADIRPMGYKRDVVVFGLGKNLLFKPILGRCASFENSTTHITFHNRFVTGVQNLVND